MPDSRDHFSDREPESRPNSAQTPPHETNSASARIAGRLQWAWAGFTERLGRLRWQHAARAAAWTGAGVGGTALLFIVAFFLALFIYTPDVSFDRDLYALNRPSAFIFKNAEGQTIGRRGAVTGERLKLTEMPAYLPAAFLAMEDRRFYTHGGIDYRGLVRALIVDIQAGHVVQGGSTITQQVAKTVFLSPERTISRKLEEMAVARAIEARLSKDEILTLYLNRIYLGSGAYGVDGAARVYFGKSAREVSLAEAAMLASLTKAPSVFSPRRDLAKAQVRASLVLQTMVETGAISDVQAAEARAYPAEVIDQTRNIASNYFFDAAAEEAQRMVGSGGGDYVVLTTMDPKMQAAANAAIARTLDGPGVRAHASQGALVAMSTDGAVRALVGGRDYASSTFNRATHALRQPGSAFKPFVYMAAFERGLDPNSVREDQPVDLDGYMPANYRRTYSGAMTLRQALVRSINTVAVQLCAEVGPSSVAAVARRMGITSPLQPYVSLALGTSEVTPLELTAAYAAFPTGGLRVQPYFVTEVRDMSGSVLYRHRSSPPSRVLDEEKAQWMNSVLFDVVQYGTGTAARVPGREVAGKTGTTSDFKDAWFVGYSADLVTAVWVGNDDPTPMRHVTGGKLPAQTWSAFMRTALSGSRPIHLARTAPAPVLDMFAGVFGDVPVEPGVTYVGDDGVEIPNTARDDGAVWQYEGSDEYEPPPLERHAIVAPTSREAVEPAEPSEAEQAATDADIEVAHEPPPAVTRPQPMERNLEDVRRAMAAHAPPPNAAIPPPDTPPPDELYPEDETN